MKQTLGALSQIKRRQLQKNPCKDFLFFFKGAVLKIACELDLTLKLQPCIAEDNTNISKFNAAYVCDQSRKK